LEKGEKPKEGIGIKTQREGTDHLASLGVRKKNCISVREGRGRKKKGPYYKIRKDKIDYNNISREEKRI